MIVQSCYIKKVMVAIKNNKIILKRIRNPVDRLWDIPMYKDGIMKGNNPMPPIHPGLYPSSLKHPTAPKNTQHISKEKYKTKQKYMQQLSFFSDIIDDNIIDNFMLKEANIINKNISMQVSHRMLHLCL